MLAVFFRFILSLLSVARGFRGYAVEPSYLLVNVLSTLFLHLFDIFHGVLLFNASRVLQTKS